MKLYIFNKIMNDPVISDLLIFRKTAMKMPITKQ